MAQAQKAPKAAAKKGKSSKKHVKAAKKVIQPLAKAQTAPKATAKSSKKHGGAVKKVIHSLAKAQEAPVVVSKKGKSSKKHGSGGGGFGSKDNGPNIVRKVWQLQTRNWHLRSIEIDLGVGQGGVCREEWQWRD